MNREGAPNEEVWINALKRAGLSDAVARDTLWFLWSVVRGLFVRALSVSDPERQARVLELARAMVLQCVATQHASGERGTQHGYDAVCQSAHR